jgi:hypothetical protein
MLAERWWLSIRFRAGSGMLVVQLGSLPDIVVQELSSNAASC